MVSSPKHLAQSSTPWSVFQDGCQRPIHTSLSPSEKMQAETSAGAFAPKGSCMHSPPRSPLHINGLGLFLRVHKNRQFTGVFIPEETKHIPCRYALSTRAGMSTRNAFQAEASPQLIPSRWNLWPYRATASGAVSLSLQSAFDLSFALLVHYRCHSNI